MVGNPEFHESIIAAFRGSASLPSLPECSRTAVLFPFDSSQRPVRVLLKSSIYRRFVYALEQTFVPGGFNQVRNDDP